MKIIKDFHNSTLKQIRWWAWAAAVLPMITLAALFFIRYIGTDTYYGIALIIGAVGMFGTAVLWWWWAIYTIANITKNLTITIEKFDDVKTDIKEIKKDVRSNSS